MEIFSHVPWETTKKNARTHTKNKSMHLEGVFVTGMLLSDGRLVLESLWLAPKSKSMNYNECIPY